mmetsp:Transcript_182466/g.444132  ORF Transcript_182466/g.444132 Transcript_182466/m.444132 type:complete len:332 (-) Transcript_182466:59-1054(-)
MVRAFALAEVLVLPVGLAAQLAAVAGGAGPEEAPALLLLPDLRSSLEVVHVLLHDAPLLRLVRRGLVGIIKGRARLLRGGLGGRARVGGDLKLVVSQLRCALRLLCQRGLGLRQDLIQFPVGLILHGLPLPASRGARGLEVPLLDLRDVRGLLRLRLRLDPRLLRALQVVGGRLHLCLSLVKVVLPAGDAGVGSLLLNRSPLVVAVLKAFGRLALAVVPRLRNAGAAGGAAGAVGPSLPAALLEGLDLLLCHHLRRGQLRTRRSLLSRPERQANARAGGHRHAREEHHASIPQATQPTTLRRKPFAELWGLLRLRQGVQEQALHLGGAGHG